MPRTFGAAASQEGAKMRRTLIASLGVMVVLLGCGPGGSPGATGAGATVPAGNAAGGFCDAALRLELADASNRQEIQAGLEAATPAGQEENVAVIRQFMERQASGDDPYKDPDFLLEYDNAVKDLWRHCGRG
jgi:hypothetical protein